MNLLFKKINPNAAYPKYAKEGDSGFDLVAVEDAIIEPGETKLIKTGLAFEIPKGYEIQVRPRSGITLKTKIRVQLGTIDSNYRGEVGVIVDNVNHVDCLDDGDILYTPSDIENKVVNGNGHFAYGTYLIREGDRIAQAILAPIAFTEFVEVDKLSETERGAKGYGSTGTK